MSNIILGLATMAIFTGFNIVLIKKDNKELEDINLDEIKEQLENTRKLVNKKQISVFWQIKIMN